MFKSKCCNADVKWVVAPDFNGDVPATMQIGTCSFQCEKCGKPCDVDVDPSLSKKEEWKLTIIRRDNGYHLEGTDLDMVIESHEEDPLKCDEVLLWEIMDYFNFGGSKHDAYRIRISREKQK